MSTASALYRRTVVRRIGSKDFEVTAFGDQINDVETLSYADRGIAVANTEDSVAQFLRRDWAGTACCPKSVQTL
jgi:hydroxymethylpyrimidine pyrophosphatase-like HAD family hydrolase